MVKNGDYWTRAFAIDNTLHGITYFSRNQDNNVKEYDKI